MRGACLVGTLWPFSSSLPPPLLFAHGAAAAAPWQASLPTTFSLWYVVWEGEPQVGLVQALCLLLGWCSAAIFLRARRAHPPAQLSSATRRCHCRAAATHHTNNHQLVICCRWGCATRCVSRGGTLGAWLVLSGHFSPVRQASQQPSTRDILWVGMHHTVQWGEPQAAVGAEWPSRLAPPTAPQQAGYPQLPNLDMTYP